MRREVQGGIEGADAKEMRKRKRMASVASVAENGGCDEDGDHEMVDRGCTEK